MPRENLLQPFGLRCARHPNAGTVKLCAHVANRNPAIAVADLNYALCAECHADDVSGRLVTVLPACVVCIRELWGWTLKVAITGALKNPTGSDVT